MPITFARVNGPRRTSDKAADATNRPSLRIATNSKSRLNERATFTTKLGLDENTVPTRSASADHSDSMDEGSEWTCIVTAVTPVST
ncbi:hypothetical protein BJI47_14645 [Rhodococcus sp. 1168]|nr:hypothetical protein BJI47_14645 [Rhodococcus sp. 1168]